MQEIAPFVRILGCYPADDSYTSGPSPVIKTAAAAEQSVAPQNGALSDKAMTNDSENLLISAAANSLPIQQVRIAYTT